MPVVESAATCPFKPTKPSFIGAPESETVLYVGKKLQDRLSQLDSCENCLVFIEKGSEVPASVIERHSVVMCDDPVWSYTAYMRELVAAGLPKEKERPYTLAEGGYYLGENVVLGKDVYIEPGVLIGHDTVIGDDTMVLAHAIIKHAVIGKRCLIKENAQVGAQAFMMATDEKGDKKRMPCLGSVAIGDEAEIGSFTTVCRGSNSVTTIADHAKLDDHVHVGHDVRIGRNVVIAASAVLGGYDILGDGVYVGLNATIKQLVTIEAGAEISMGMRVTKDVKADSIMFGAPAKKE